MLLYEIVKTILFARGLDQVPGLRKEQGTRCQLLQIDIDRTEIGRKDWKGPNSERFVLDRFLGFIYWAH